MWWATSDRGRSALANGHGGEAPRGSVDSGSGAVALLELLAGAAPAGVVAAELLVLVEAARLHHRDRARHLVGGQVGARYGRRLKPVWLRGLIVLVGLWCRSLSPLFLTKLNLLDLATPYVFIGLLAGGFQAAGEGWTFWALVLPHGFLELTAICIAGGAGLRIGW